MTTGEEIRKLKFSANGSPWARLTVPSVQNVDQLNRSANGSPWWGYTPTALITWVAGTLKVYLNGQWTAKPLKIFSAGSWLPKTLKIHINT